MTEQKLTKKAKIITQLVPEKAKNNDFRGELQFWLLQILKRFGFGLS